MHRGDEEVHNAKLILEHFGDRCQGVGRTRGHGEHVVPRAVVLGLVDPRHDGHIDIVRGSTDQHFPGPRLQMPSGVFASTQRPRRFNHYIDPSLAPGDFRRLGLRGKLHRSSIYQ